MVMGASGDEWVSITLRRPIHLMCWLRASQKVIERVHDSCCSRNKVALKVYHAHKLPQVPYGRVGQLFSLKGQIGF